MNLKNNMESRTRQLFLCCLRFGIDAERIHEIFRGHRFKRIHWNCPFGFSGSPKEKEAFRQVLPNFFLSSSQLQLAGDQTHVTLMQRSGECWKKRQKENIKTDGKTVDLKDFYFECSSDEDSSDYYESD